MYVRTHTLQLPVGDARWGVGVAMKDTPHVGSIPGRFT